MLDDVMLGFFSSFVCIYFRSFVQWRKENPWSRERNGPIKMSDVYTEWADRMIEDEEVGGLV